MIFSRFLLLPFGLLYGLLNSLRNWLFDRGILKSTGFDLPLINVGNLAVGGEGKSPHIEYLLRLLSTEYTCAVLSRGYKRKSKGFVLADEESTAASIGDEPMQFHQKFSGITVAVDKDRTLAIPRILHERHETALILMDDAYQHRYVKPGLNILISSCKRPFYHDWPMPAGRLREFAAGYKRADIIVMSKCDPQMSPEEMAAIRKSIRPLPTQQVYFSSIRYAALQALHKNEPAPHSASACVLFTGIAQAEPLLAHCRQQFKEVLHMPFADHHPFTRADIEKIIARFNQLRAEHKILLCTEKDAMRLSAEHIALLKNYPVFYQPIEIYFLQEQAQFDQSILSYVRSHQRKH